MQLQLTKAAAEAAAAAAAAAAAVTTLGPFQHDHTGTIMLIGRHLLLGPRHQSSCPPPYQIQSLHWDTLQRKRAAAAAATGENICKFKQIKHATLNKTMIVNSKLLVKMVKAISLCCVNASGVKAMLGCIDPSSLVV
jgi:hypothetical protein